jgi:alkanesulfonate monooxygenase SsuD/methylene tetrahydromethanopterin reductase-like flavin-dependent oxidoreductase (luciferase family)
MKLSVIDFRIGSAGVMLPHYSALKVAEQFRVLEGITRYAEAAW